MHQLKKSRKFIPAALVCAAIGTALPAAAVSIFEFSNLDGIGTDFKPDVVGTHPWTTANGIDIIPTTVGGRLQYTDNGLTLTAYGTFIGSGGSQPGVVVQDSISGGELAGLGVYSHGLSALAAGAPLPSPYATDTSDDNVTGVPGSPDETLWIEFDGPAEIQVMRFRDADHHLLESGTYLLSVDGGATEELVFGANITRTGSVFAFSYGGTAANQFYLETLTADAVPDGGSSLALLGLSFLGFGAMRRFSPKK